MKISLSILLRYLVLFLPFVLPFITYQALGIFGYEIPKVMIFSLVMIASLMLVIFSWRKTVIHHVWLIFYLWFFWNSVTSVANHVVTSAWWGDIYFSFGLGTLSLLLLYGILVQQVFLKKFSSLIIGGFIVVGIVHTVTGIVSLIFQTTFPPVPFFMYRITSTLGEPNWFGSIMLVSFVFAVVVSVTAGKGVRKGLYGILILLLTGMVLSGSRSVWIAGAVTLPIVVVFAVKNYSARLMTLFLITVLLIFGGICLVSGKFISQMPVQGRGFSGTDSRLWIYQKGLDLALRKPLTGYGWEQVGTIYKDPLPNTYPGIEDLLILRSHNIFLDISLSGGIIGLVLFVLAVSVSLYEGLLRYEVTKNTVFLGTTVTIFSLLLYAQLNTFSIAHWVIFFFCVGITTSQSSKERVRS